LLLSCLFTKAAAYRPPGNAGQRQALTLFARDFWNASGEHKSISIDLSIKSTNAQPSFRASFIRALARGEMRKPMHRLAAANRTALLRTSRE
jgi:hypothetical protein